jgi:Rrf2 family protein
MVKSKKNIISVSELVKETKIPRPFLRRILQILHKNKILVGYKGLGGGFKLRLKPEKIYILDLVKIFQKDLKLNECLFKKKICSNIKNCKLKKVIDSIQNYAISKLSSITIKSLLN